MKLQESFGYNAVVWLMVGLTCELGFAQAGAPITGAVYPTVEPLRRTATSQDLHGSKPSPPPSKQPKGGGEPAGWLSATVDANFNDRFIQELLVKIGPGVSNAFAFVRDQVGYEAYTGSLRGARGTLWSQAGNSLDQSSLLIALLRGQGIGARYVRGTLSTNDARVLIRSMFDPVIAASAVGYIPERFPIYDPETDPGLLRWSSDHWWVELEDGTQLDPSFAGSAIDQVRGRPTATCFEVPDELRHKIVVRLKAELHNPLSQYSYQTPLEVAFSTPEVYGKALTLGHFINVYQPPALVTGWKTYTYSPYLMVDNNDADWSNNELIRGTDYQEFLTGLFPLANSTLTRLTLEFEARDPGKAPDLRTRDILDRVGYAARKGLAEPGPVDTSKPALTEFDMSVFYVTPGGFHTNAVTPAIAGLRTAQMQMEARRARVAELVHVDPTRLTAENRLLLSDYSKFVRHSLFSVGSIVAGSFLLYSDRDLRSLSATYLVKAYYDTPRLTLFESRTCTEETNASVRMSLDIRRNLANAIPFSGQNAVQSRALNVVKGYRDSALEHVLIEALFTNTLPVDLIVACPMAVFAAAESLGIPRITLATQSDLLTLEPIGLSPEAKARICDAVVGGCVVNVPSRMVQLHGMDSIAWWEINSLTGETVSVAEDGGHPDLVEYECNPLGALLLTGFSMTVSALFIWFSATYPELTEIIMAQHGMANDAKMDEAYQAVGALTSVIGKLTTPVATDEQGSSTTIETTGTKLHFRFSKNVALNGANVVGGVGSTVDFAKSDVEAIALYAPEPESSGGPSAHGTDMGIEVLSDSIFVLKHLGNQVPSAFRLAIANSGLPDPGNLSAYRSRTNESFLFQVTGNTTNRIWGTDTYTDTSPLATAAVHAGVLTDGQTGTVKVSLLPSQGYYEGSNRNGVNSIIYSAWDTSSYRFVPPDPVADAAAFTVSGQVPAGWHLLFARTNTSIPPGITGELSVFLQPDEAIALPSPNAAVDFTLAVSGGRTDPTAVVTQQVHFVMPEIHGLKVTGTPGTIYSSPNGTNSTKLLVLNTGNVDETVTLTLAPPRGFVLSGLTSPVTLGPGVSVTQTVTFAAQSVAVNSDHYSTLTAQFGPTNGLAKELEFRVHVAVPGALESLQAANDARAINRAALAETLDSLGKALSQLYGVPNNQVQRSRVLANLAAVAGGLDDPLLAPFAPSLLAVRDQLAAATDDQVTAALEALDAPMRAFTDFLRILARHDFEVALQPNATDAQPQTATSFGLYLKNKGTQTTTYRIDLSGVPPGITRGLTQTNITLLPGQATSPTLSGVEHVSVVLTQSTNQLTAFDFTVTVTVAAAPQITRDTVGSFTAREELVQVLEVRTDPMFLEPKWERTEIGVITGGDAGEGLDLDGSFLYAVNVGGNAVGRIRNAEFTGPNVPGVTLTARWTGPTQHPRVFGTNDNDNRLETVILTDRYGRVSDSIVLELANLTPGRPYKLQLLFAEDWTVGRGFDVIVDEAMSANDFNIGGVQGGVAESNRAVVLTHEFLATDTMVNVTLSGSHVANFSNRDPLLCGFTLEALPQKWVSVSARVLNAVNVDRPVLAHFTVKDAAGIAVVQSVPQRFALSVVSSVDDFALGGFDPTVLTPGVYRIEVQTTELDGTPLAGGVGTGTFLLGSPVAAELTCSATNLPPCDNTVDLTLNIASQVDFGTNDIKLIGLHSTPGTAQFLALGQGVAYVGGTENGELMEVHNPWNPRMVGQFATNDIATAMFGNRLLGRQGFGLDVFGLDDPARPARIGSCEAGFSGSTFPTHFFTHGNFAFANALIFGYGSTAVDFARGDLVSYDLTNPTNPVSMGLLFKTPHTSFTNYVGSDYFIGQAAAKDGIVLLPSTTGKDAANSGTGRLILADARTPGQVTTNGELLVAGTRVLTAVAISGSRALALGNTAGFIVSLGLPVSAGEVTATVLDVTDPLHPSVLGTTQTMPGVDQAVRWKLHAFPGPNELFFVSDVTQNGKPALWVLDTSNPTNIQNLAIEVPAAVKFAEFKDGLLYTAGGYGLGIYDLGGVLGIPVATRVRVPNDGAAAIVPGSFTVAPDQIIAGTNDDTLVWHFTLSSALTNRLITWHMGLTNLAPNEAREVVLGAEVDFTAWGKDSSLDLPPLTVVGQHVLGLAPPAQTVHPGESATFTLTVTNATAAPVTCALTLQGLPTNWVALAPSMLVPTQSQAQVLLVLQADTAAAAGDYGFTVRAQTTGGMTDTVAGTLTLSGAPVVADQAYGVVVTLSPSQATAGQGTPAHYVVRLVNTGNGADTYALSAQVPAGSLGQLGSTNVEVLPGLDNYREVLLTVTPAPGTAAGEHPFTVMATSTTEPSEQSVAAGTVSVVNLGVALGLSPRSAPPGSTFTLAVTNTGQQAQTFDLALGGPVAPSASLPTSQVTLPAGASQVIPVSVSSLDYGYPGDLSLHAVATARDNTNVTAQAAAVVQVAANHGVTALFEPALVGVPAPGKAFALLVLRSSGNTEDAFTARIASTSGQLTASLHGATNQLVQQTGTLRLPGLSSGGVLLEADLTQHGTGAVQVVVSSLEHSNVTAQAMVGFRCGVWLSFTWESIIELSFDPIPGRDHFFEYCDSLMPGSTWAELPGGPYNRGLYYLCMPTNCDAFPPDPNGATWQFIDRGNLTSRYYRLWVEGTQPVALRARIVKVSALTFLPLPGYDHVAERTDNLSPPVVWTDLPAAPQNLGLAIDNEPGSQRFYRVRLQMSQP